ncbi:hypothetical protein [Paraflavitalea pollutisoli]|uniref:hypothetical protein n=1 Tax=Paraflavitalea pollutisoli TaxID=3034143 RepID=UPI0023EC079B|nr:hypothetical protein [Paraflavitalea sp. H1-2-19X]
MKLRHITAATALVVTLWGCNKDDVGFLSDRLFYRANPFTAAKGRVTTSAPLETDGSTQALTVKLLAVRDKTGAVTDVLSKEYEIPIYKGEILFSDSTLDMLSKKLGTAMYKPFNVNELGGRLEVTPASMFVDTGIYDFDVQASNVKGTIVLNSIARVRINPAVPFQLVRQFASTSVTGQEATFVTQANFAVTVDRVPAGPNKIIVKFVDKNGATFNPKTGQVIPRATLAGTTGLRYSFKQFAPYYAEEITDTALVYQYPDKTPTYPLFVLNNAYLSSYRIPAAFNDLNQNINPEFSVRLYPADQGIPYVKGTWIITNRVNFAAKK